MTDRLIVIRGYLRSTSVLITYLKKNIVLQSEMKMREVIKKDEFKTIL